VTYTIPANGAILPAETEKLPTEAKKPDVQVQSQALQPVQGQTLQSQQQPAPNQPTLAPSVRR